ncbi:hypothetical protein PG593_10930 [Riemerella anatipestifer]|nr:hypothetical protein [Riemerella anatipestifer]
MITERAKSKRINQLLRYKSIMEEFEKYNSQDIPITVIHRKYIYPKFFISRDTLYRIFKTPIDEQLVELGYSN